MEILVIMLLLPFAGGLLLMLDWHRRSGLDRDSRDFGRRLLGLLGWVVLLHAAAIGGWALLGIALFLQEQEPLLALAIMARLLVACILAFAGTYALLNSRHDEREDLEISVQYRQSIEADRLWAGALLMVGLPLAAPAGVVIVICVGMFGLFELASAFGQTARTNRLLWSLALAASNGRPFRDEVVFLAENERSNRWRKNYLDLASDLGSGTSLTTALLTHARFLPHFVLSSVAVAEENGTLPTVLQQLAVRNTAKLDQVELEQDMGGVVFMFWVVGLTALWIITFICYWIVPKYKAIFNDFGLELPPLTQRFLNVADWFANYWFLVLPMISVPFLVLYGLYHVTIGAAQGRSSFLTRYVPSLESTSLLRTLAEAIRIRAPLPRSLEQISQLHQQAQQRERIVRVQSRVAMSDPIGAALLDEGFVGTRQSHALRLAEELGHLPWCMHSLADQIDRRRLETFRWAIEFLRPAFTILLGLIVLFYSVAMFQPLTSILEALS